jgi:hypothetical protein
MKLSFCFPVTFLFIKTMNPFLWLIALVLFTCEIMFI